MTSHRTWNLQWYPSNFIASTARMPKILLLFVIVTTSCVKWFYRLQIRWTEFIFNFYTCTGILSVVTLKNNQVTLYGICINQKKAGLFHSYINFISRTCMSTCWVWSPCSVKANSNKLTLEPVNIIIKIFTQLKLCFATKTQNFRWLNLQKTFVNLDF